MTWKVLQGNCIEVMAEMEEATVDAVVCDPPYGIGFMGHKWDQPGVKGKSNGKVTKHCRGHHRPSRSASMVAGKYDLSLSANHRYQAWCEAWARECLRVLRPGGHLLAFGGPRTYQRLACGIEDAGLEIRDSIMWLYGSGFPKSLNVGKANAGKAHRPRGDWNRLAQTALGELGTALKPAHEPIVVARKPLIGTVAENVLEHGTGALSIDACRIGFDSDSDRASAKPGGCPTSKDGGDASTPDAGRDLDRQDFTPADNSAGRWPANVVLSHLEECEQLKGVSRQVRSNSQEGGRPASPPSAILGAALESVGGAGYGTDGYEEVPAWNCAPGCSVAGLDAQSGELKSGRLGPHHSRGTKTLNVYGRFADNEQSQSFGGDSGGASRFFYCAKASRAERNAGLEGFDATKSADHGYGSIQRPKLGRAAPRQNWEPHKTANNHPTVKPISLMRWLVCLVTPPGGLILDPFLGSGSTGCAAVLEGFNFLGVEREPDYCRIAAARCSFWSGHVGSEVKGVLDRERTASRRRSARAQTRVKGVRQRGGRK